MDWQGAVLPWALPLVHPVGRALLNHRYTSDEEGVSTDTATSGKSLHKKCGGRGNRGNQSGSDSDETPTPGGRQKKKDGFSSKIQIPEMGARRVILTMWPTPIGNGPVALHIIANTMRIPTSCP